MAYNRYKFKTLEQAILIMGVDVETGLYHHQFYLKKFNDEEIENNSPNQLENVCIICNDIKERHYEIQMEEFSSSCPNASDVVVANNNFREFALKDELNKKKVKTFEIDKSYIDKLEFEFKDKNLCIICYDSELNDQNSYTFNCLHKFCKNCVKNYLENLIKNSKVENVKCLQAGCTSSIPENIIRENTSKENFIKFIRFKKRNLFLINLQKGFIPCTAPDCEEWVSYKEGMETFVECGEGHKFCAKCKEDWHKKKTCKNVNIK